MQAEDAISKHFRLTSQQIAALRKLGLRTIRDLLYHFPARYETLGRESDTAALVVGAKVTLFGTVSNLKAKKLWRSRRPATEGWLEDSRGKVKCIWFNQPYIRSYVPDGSFVKMTGTVGGSEKSPYIANPEMEIIPQGAIPEGMFKETPVEKDRGTFFPVYPESKGITSRWFYHALDRIFKTNVHLELSDPIPEDIRERYHLPELSAALVWMHIPDTKGHAEAAKKRFSFEEIFTLQVARALDRAQNDNEGSFEITDASNRTETFLSSIPFPPTGAQRRAIGEIIDDFHKRHPMARLLEGDVGAGKTLVAAATAYAVVHSRPPNRTSGTLQVAYMAPTEILAAQHFDSFIEYFKDLPINIALLTGGEMIEEVSNCS